MADRPNVYGEGKLACEIAERLLRKLEDGEDISPELRLMERVDGLPARSTERESKQTVIVVNGIGPGRDGR